MRPHAGQEGQSLRALGDVEGSEPKRVRLSISRDTGIMVQGDAPPCTARVKRGAEQPLSGLKWDAHQGDAAPRLIVTDVVAGATMREREDLGEESPSKSPRRDDQDADRFSVDTVSLDDVINRKVVNQDRPPQAMIRGTPTDLVEKGMERELNYLKDMDVFTRVREREREMFPPTRRFSIVVGQ